MRNAALALLVLLTLAPSGALARRAPLDVEVGRGAAADADAMDDTIGTRAGMARRPVRPPYAPTVADLNAGLARARAGIEACLAESGYVGTVRVSARIDVSHALTVTVSPRPANAQVRDCAELATQRQLTNVAARLVHRPLRGSITVRRRAPAAPHPAPSPPPRSPGDAAIESSVRARLDQDRAGLLQCLSSAAPGVAGEASLRVTVQRDGSVVLSSASLPTGVPAGPALPCLSSRVSALRFSPAPGHAVVVTHRIALGL